MQKKHKNTRHRFSSSLQPASCKACTHVWGWIKGNISSIDQAEWLFLMGKAQISQRLRKMVHIPIIILSSGKLQRRLFPLCPPLVLVKQPPCSSLWDLYVFFPLSKQLSNAMHERHPKYHPPGDFSPAERRSVGVPGSFPTISPDSQIRLARAPFSLNCMFVFMCWLLCLVSYNPVGADPKPCFKKKSNYFIP